MVNWPAGLSATILATLALILGGSVAIFNLLGRRVTIKRRELALQQWVSDRGAKIISRANSVAPARLEMLGPRHPKAHVVIESAHWTLAELSTDSPPEAKGKFPRWRLLALQISASPPWPATGLRPVDHAISLLDLVGLSSFPSLSSGERFVVFGTDPAAALKLAESAAQTLLPPDVGLLLCGSVLVLDFSGRRFESVEFQRLLVIAEQLAKHV